jgi:hypothetical protein
MKRNIFSYLIILVLLIIVIIIIQGQTKIQYYEGALSDTTDYTFDPYTILSSLDRESTDLFVLVPTESEKGLQPLAAPGTFNWNQQDYLRIANAIHKHVWGSSLKEWQLIRALFNVYQCHDVINRIDQVDFSFYGKENNSYVVHGIRINPLEGVITTGQDHFNYNGKRIELDEVKLSSFDSALLVAEQNGGSEARLRANTECSIDALLAPYVLPGFLNQFDWGWNIGYYDKSPSGNNRIVFSINIDPYSGDNYILPIE